jgi:hypothetical protein
MVEAKKQARRRSGEDKELYYGLFLFTAIFIAFVGLILAGYIS